MPAPRGMSEFQGFEDPPLNVNAPNWKDRITALYDEHPGRWAKYGPYSGKGSAQGVASHIRTQLTPYEQELYQLRFQVADTDIMEWYLYIKVGENNGVQEESQPTLFSIESDRSGAGSFYA